SPCCWRQRGSSRCSTGSISGDEGEQTPHEPRSTATFPCHASGWAWIAICDVLGSRAGASRARGTSWPKLSLGAPYGIGGRRPSFASGDRLAMSQVYEALEPVLNGHRVTLLDVPILEQQFLELMWKGGKITHPTGEHDDHANAVAGVVALVAVPSSVPLM